MNEVIVSHRFLELLGNDEEGTGIDRPTIFVLESISEGDRGSQIFFIFTGSVVSRGVGTHPYNHRHHRQ